MKKDKQLANLLSEFKKAAKERWCISSEIPEEIIIEIKIKTRGIKK